MNGRWDRISGILGVASFIAIMVGLAMVFLYAPTEASMGDVQRIFYFHVASAWVWYLTLFVLFVGSILYLWKRDRQWDVLALSSAEIGILFGSLVLLTGPLWGKSVWGTFWAWDPRLTSSLVTWLLIVGYMMLRSTTEAGETRARLAAVLGVISFLMVPIIHFSVVWWRTLHPQPIIIRPGGPAAAPEFVQTLVVCVIAFTIFYFYLLIQRVRLERSREAVEVLKQEFGY